MTHTYPYKLVDGHIVVQCGQYRVVVDTGSPKSYAACDGVRVAGTLIPWNDGARVCACISTRTKARVDALIGNDILANFDVMIEPDTSTIMFDTTEPPLRGESLPIEFDQEVPVIEVSRIDGVHVPGENEVVRVCGRTRLFFDTGARLSYLALSDDMCARLHTLGQDNDFHPSCGTIQVPQTYQVIPWLGDHRIHVKVGRVSVLPLALRQAMQDVKGILGTALFDRFALHYAPRRKRLALRMLRPARLDGGDKKVPAWLERAATGAASQPLPLKEMLKNSLYYPASGLNGTPVKFLAGSVHSFVYVDYAIKRDEFRQNLLGKDKDAGFLGYHCVMQREVSRDDIVPREWSPTMVPTDVEDLRRIQEAQKRCELFGHWSIWCRNADKDDTHGPKMFSFLFLAGEMSAVYQGLYTRLGVAPLVLAIIQPGAMGGEWEQVEDDNAFFKKVVNENPAGVPRYLLNGGYGGTHGTAYSRPCWTGYEGPRLCALPERHAGLWEWAENAPPRTVESGGGDQ